jgi:GTP cyclohydrolase IB
VTLQTSVTGTVSLDADKKGINMSRIMRSFYAHAEKRFSMDVIEAALDDYKTDLESFDARIQMRFSFPMRVESLRSGLSAGSITTSRWNWSTGRAAAAVRASRLRLFLDLPLLAGTERTRARRARPAGHAAFAALGRAAVGRGAAGRGAVVRGPDRDLPPPPCRPRRRSWSSARTSRPSPNSTPPIRSSSRMRRGSSARAGRRSAHRRLPGVASHQESLHSHDAVSLLTRGPTFATDSLDPRSSRACPYRLTA